MERAKGLLKRDRAAAAKEVRRCYSSDPSLQNACWVFPVARYSAYEIALHIWEEPAVAVCGVAPVTATICRYFRLVHIGAMQAPLLYTVPLYHTMPTFSAPGAFGVFVLLAVVLVLELSC